MKSLSRALFPIGFVVLTLATFACAPAATPAPTSAPAPTVVSTGAPSQPSPVPASASSQASGKTLNVSWFAFNNVLIDKNITTPFEQKYGVKIQWDTGNNADRLSKLVARKDKPNVDVVAFSTEFAMQGMKQGVIQPLDPNKLQNLNQLYDWAKNPLGDYSGVGYTVSYYTLFYRTDKAKQPITSWKDLWRPDLKGYVSLPTITTTNGPATIYLIAKAWGGDMNNDKPAWDKLAELKDSLVTAYKNSAELTTLVQQGDVWAGGYSSFAWPNLLATKAPIKSVIPQEGAVGFVNTLSIVKGTTNEDLAYKFIDFIISQEAQKAEAMDLVDSPANKQVQLPPEVAEKLTYGDETIKSLNFLNEAQLATKRADWLDKWNKLMAK